LPTILMSNSDMMGCLEHDRRIREMKVIPNWSVHYATRRSQRQFKADSVG
jgi:hypothetical protein